MQTTDIKNLPNFSSINFSKINQELLKLLDENRRQIESILATHPSEWQELIPKLTLIDNKLNCFWSPINHLHGVSNTQSLREVYELCLPALISYANELGQNTELQQAFYRIKHSGTFASLSQAQKKVINNALRDFHLAGVDLPASKKLRFQEISSNLAKLSTQYENNLLDATQSWQKHVTDKKILAGLPETALNRARGTAKKQNLDGWILTLDFPSYFAVISHAENAELRQEIYKAYTTRASELADQPALDNSHIMIEILQLRHEKAKLLEYLTYADYSVETKMVESASKVIQFLEDLIEKCKPYAKAEYQQLTEFVLEHHQIEQLNPWDIAYYSEKLKEFSFNVSQEKLRPYFPVDRVLEGFFTIVNKLYGITFKSDHSTDVWDESVKCYELYDRDEHLRGICYLDLYTRKDKRSGAWMDSYCQRFRLDDGRSQLPVAFITCNFMPPSNSHPSLLTHDDVTTLFHEFGHGLHHLLTTVDHYDISGIAGVPWDAVELPSQFMENWCWQKETMPLISRHYQSGEPLPDRELDQLIQAKNFQSAMAMLRQLEFALFDIKIHTEFDPKSNDIQTILDQVRANTSVVPISEFNRFQHSFSHIFAGGYAAGYYSYLWAEVLSADAFTKFEETGIFNAQTGDEFLTQILQQGGSAEPLELFVNFRGRKPTDDALLKSHGLK